MSKFRRTIRAALDAHGHDGTFEAAAQLRDEVVRMRAEVAALKAAPIKWDSAAEVLMADYGRRTIRQLHDRYLEALALESENDKLQAEVERLRGLGLDAVDIAAGAREGAGVIDLTRDGVRFTARVEGIRAEIERNP